MDDRERESRKVSDLYRGCFLDEADLRRHG